MLAARHDDDDDIWVAPKLSLDFDGEKERESLWSHKHSFFSKMFHFPRLANLCNFFLSIEESQYIPVMKAVLFNSLYTGYLPKCMHT